MKSPQESMLNCDVKPMLAKGRHCRYTAHRPDLIQRGYTRI